MSEQPMLTVGSLFSGIGGFDLGLERAGMRVIWQSEIDPYASAVLRKHWPDVPNLGDIREIRNPPTVDVLCGGFPCQDISTAGKGAGIDGERSGLWREYVRIIGEIRPRFVFVENVAALLGRGLGRVLGDLAALGYDAEWHCIPASAVGAHHERDRLWIVAHSDPVRELQPEGREQDERGWNHHGAEDAADADGSRLQERFMHPGISRQAGCDDDGQDPALDPWRTAESPLVRGVHGIPNRLDRIKALGNAIVPQIAEIIGRAIVRVEVERAHGIGPASHE